MNRGVRGLVASAAAVLPGAISQAQSLCGASGGDLVLSHIEGVQNQPAVDGSDFLVLATRQTNVGSVSIAADLGTVHHPVQAPNLFRHTMVGGISRFEQIGMGWCFHAGIPLNMGGFCTCQGGSQSTIGPGCSDPHGTAFMGLAQYLGPRWEVNATTGTAAHPHAIPPAGGGRIQFSTADVDPAVVGPAAYFGELIVLHPDEPAANTLNNAGWRPLTLSYAASNATIGLTGSTTAGQAAIEAWKTLVPGVSEAALDVPGDGRFILAARVVRVGGNNWNYEYAVYNLNSHRSARAFGLPRAAGLLVTQSGFHDVDYHSGDGPGGSSILGTDWEFSAGTDQLLWQTEAFEVNQAANALRWGTLYNFRVTCNAAPTAGEPVLELFRVGEPGQMSAPLPVPGELSCLGDHDGDGARAVPDIFAFLADWFAQHAAGDADGDGTNTVPDVFTFLSAWFGGC